MNMDESLLHVLIARHGIDDGTNNTEDITKYLKKCCDLERLVSTLDDEYKTMARYILFGEELKHLDATTTTDRSHREYIEKKMIPLMEEQTYTQHGFKGIYSTSLKLQNEKIYGKQPRENTSRHNYYQITVKPFKRLKDESELYVEFVYEKNGKTMYYEKKLGKIHNTSVPGTMLYSFNGREFITNLKLVSNLRARNPFFIDSTDNEQTFRTFHMIIDSIIEFYLLNGFISLDVFLEAHGVLNEVCDSSMRNYRLNISELASLISTAGAIRYRNINDTRLQWACEKRKRELDDDIPDKDSNFLPLVKIQRRRHNPENEKLIMKNYIALINMELPNIICGLKSKKIVKKQLDIDEYGIAYSLALKNHLVKNNDRTFKTVVPKTLFDVMTLTLVCYERISHKVSETSNDYGAANILYSIRFSFDSTPGMQYQVIDLNDDAFESFHKTLFDLFLSILDTHAYVYNKEKSDDEQDEEEPLLNPDKQPSQYYFLTEKTSIFSLSTGEGRDYQHSIPI